jgi:hypothetical protein
MDLTKTCSALQSATTTNEMREWLRTEVNSAIGSSTNRPTQTELQGELPRWVFQVYGISRPYATLVLDSDWRTDHVELLWAHGRGMLGIVIGNEQFKLDGNRKYADCIIIECQPGIFIWSPKHFP